MTLPETSVCVHQWDPEPPRGTTLRCLYCDVDWPGDPNWPPPYVCRVEGFHRDELIANDVWTVQRMIRELRRMPDVATG